MANHEAILFDVHDFKVYALTDDSGASPVFGPAVDVYGIAEVGLDMNLVTAELKGDGKIIAKRGKIDRLPLSATYGRLAGDVLEVVLGAEVSDPTVDQARIRLLAGQRLPYFRASFIIEDADNGIEDVQVHCYKCQITGGTLLGQSTDNFGQPSFTMDAIGLAATDPEWMNVMADLEFFSVATPLPA